VSIHHNPNSTSAKLKQLRLNQEWSQSLMRLCVVLAVFIYFLFTDNPILFTVSIVALLSASIIFLWVTFSPETNHARRVLMSIVDISTVTVCLYFSDGEEGALFIGLFLWIITGYAFRYGVKYLLLTTSLTLAGFTTVIFSNPFWFQHLHMAIGDLVIILAVPLFMAGLINKLNAAIDLAERANRSKTQFLANMSHELRTPLNGIIGASDLLSMTKLSAEQQKYIGLIKNSGHTLLALIEDVLDISKIEAGKQSSELKPFDLHELVASTVYLFQPQAKKKELALNYHFEHSIPFRLHGDELHLRQILMNFLSNAMKFTSHGSVKVLIEPITHEPEQPLWLRFRIVDTGIGMSDSAQKKIFDSFVQADVSVTRKYGGTGLGTTISKQLIELMGGKVGILSKQGKGTEFWFDLPFNIQEKVPKEDVAAATSFSGIRVLTLLSKELMPSFTRPLERWGQEVKQASSIIGLPLELIEAQASQQPFHIVIIDESQLAMPAANFINSVQSESKLSNVSFILVGRTYFERYEVNQLIQAGYIAALSTPVNESFLFNAIHEVCIGKKVTAGVISVAEYQQSKYTAGALNILVAEDNEVNQIVIQRFLELMGHHVKLVADGELALDQLSDTANQFDLAILDVNMPNLSGLDALKAYRFLEAERHLPIIMLSADALASNIQECLEAGADAYLTKPVDYEKLLNSIHTLHKSKTIEQKPEQTTPRSDKLTSIDEELLNQLNSMASKEGFLENLIHKFSLATKEKIQQLKQASLKCDTRTFMEIIHTLKGNSGTIGATSIMYLCENIEKTKAKLTSETMLQHTTDLDNLFQSSSQKFNRYLKEGSSQTINHETLH